jgi:hypothetical protein
MATNTPAPKTGTPATAAPAAAELLPSATSLLHAARIAIKEDYPIQLDYYADSCTDKAFIGQDDATKEKILIKARDEYTSNISKVFRVGNEFIILTENSLYIVAATIKTKRLSMDSLE